MHANSVNIFNRAETDKRLRRLERKLSRMCCSGCTDNIGDITINTSLGDDGGSEVLLLYVNDAFLYDGHSGSYSVEGHLWSGQVIPNVNGQDKLQIVSTGGSITVYDVDFNIIFQNNSMPEEFTFTFECDVPYGQILISA